MHTEKLLLGQNKKSNNYVITPLGTIALPGNKAKPFAYYQKKTSRKVVWTAWGKFGIMRVQFQETIPKVYEYTEEQALNIARKKAAQNARQKMVKGASVTSTRVKILSTPSENIMRVKVSLECRENIVVSQPINMMP
jgi:hypothetical protein